MKLSTEARVRLGIATEQDFAELGVERVSEIKAASETTHYRGMVRRMVAAPKGYGDRRVIRGIASTEDRDHYGDIVRVRGRGEGKGWLLEHYKAQGGPVLWSHGISPFGGGLTDVPIARAVKTWRGQAMSRGVKKLALIQDMEFYSVDAGESDHFKFSDAIYRILSGEGLPDGEGQMGFSVGFVPSIVHIPEDPEERAALGLGKYGVEHQEQVLLENTVTPTPANPFASVINGQKSFERQFDAMVDRGKIPASLAKDFKRLAFGADAAEDELQARLSKRVFFRSDVGDEAPAEEKDAPILDLETIREATEKALDDDDPVEFEAVTDPEADPDDEDQESADDATGDDAPDVEKSIADAVREALTVTTEKSTSENEPDAVVLRFTPKGAEMLERGVHALDLAFTILDTIKASVEEGREALDWGASIDLGSDSKELLSDIRGEVRQLLTLAKAGQSGGLSGSHTDDAGQHLSLEDAVDQIAARLRHPE